MDPTPKHAAGPARRFPPHPAPGRSARDEKGAAPAHHRGRVPAGPAVAGTRPLAERVVAVPDLSWVDGLVEQVGRQPRAIHILADAFHSRVLKLGGPAMHDAWRDAVWTRYRAACARHEVESPALDQAMVRGLVGSMDAWHLRLPAAADPGSIARQLDFLATRATAGDTAAAAGLAQAHLGLEGEGGRLLRRQCRASLARSADRLPPAQLRPLAATLVHAGSPGGLAGPGPAFALVEPLLAGAVAAGEAGRACAVAQGIIDGARADAGERVLGRLLSREDPLPLYAGQIGAHLARLHPAQRALRRPPVAPGSGENG